MSIFNRMIWVVLLGQILLVFGENVEWRCPDMGNASCSCDLPHTLRCIGTQDTFPIIADALRQLKPPMDISLLDCTIQDLNEIREPLFPGVSLHGLVVSSGKLKIISSDALRDLKKPLEALGFPNNELTSVPTQVTNNLSALTRLDLSHNLLVSLNNNSFKGLLSLEFLDLSGNHLQNVSGSAFIQLSRLKTLRLQSNNLNSDSISKLFGLLKLEELDLNNNDISGPLDIKSLPRFPRLLALNLAHNQISSITKGALTGLDSLQYLSLSYNMIDVLEDHAFRGLSTVTTLDLAHNRIVAVSEASLAHLNKLESLDVSNNFLRALTGDLVSSLNKLKELKLDDNDISMISNDALKTAYKIEKLSLSENPLNCDCNLAGFAEWLHNSSIAEKYKNTAVCATPPTLENGLVEEILPDQLVCASQDNLPVNNGQNPMPVSGSRVTLQGFNYDGKNMYLLWNIDTVDFYYCDSLFIYEELGTHEVLLEDNRLQCNSSTLADPHTLPISLETPHLQIGHRYRYCVVLVENARESALVLGCSEVIPLTKQVRPQIISLRANITKASILTIQAQVWPQNMPCVITVYVSVLSAVLKQLKINCSTPKVTTKSPTGVGPFKICAVISEITPYCIWTTSKYAIDGTNTKSVPSFLFCLSVLIFVVVIYVLYRWLKSLFNQPIDHEQCFLPNTEIEQQHSRYVKLQTTTIL